LTYTSNQAIFVLAINHVLVVMIKNIILSVSLSLVTLLVYSQGVFKYAHNDSIIVVKNGAALSDPWAGGMNNPQFNEIDVNFDCLNDLVVLDKDGSVLKVYVKDTLQGNTYYHSAPEYIKYFPDDINDILLIRDYNNDGKPDIFTNNTPELFGGNGLKVYKNVSDSILKFELITAHLPALFFQQPSEVLIKAFDFPTIEDIDGDGDLDIVSAHQIYLSYQYYENVSPNHDSLEYEYREYCWGQFFQRDDGTVVFGWSCKGGGIADTSSSVARHGGAAITAIDLTGNGVKDILLGDPDRANIIALTNVGTPTSAMMDTANYHFPGPINDAVDLPSFPLAFVLDVSHNDTEDLIVAPNQYEGSKDTGNVWRFENVSTSNIPDFQFQEDNFLIGDQIDVGTNAIPVLADISGDNIPDLLVGNLGYFVSYDPDWFITEYNSKVAYFKNTGTINKPAFQLITDDLANLSSKNLDRLAPAFADLDGDGDNDMLLAQANGYISYYRNDGFAGMEANFVLVTDTFMNQNFGVLPNLFLYDVDKDQTLDLLVGQKNGHVRLFLNQGTTSSPIYTTSATDTLGGIFSYNPGFESNAVPFIGKLNGGSTTTLVIGDGAGNLMYYDGLDTDYMGTFTLIDSQKVSHSPINITGADLTGNDSLELIVGERPGGLMYLNLDSIAYGDNPYPRDTCGQHDPVGIWEERSPKSEFGIFPNPNNGNFTVQIPNTISGSGLISLIDLSGKVIYSQGITVAKGENLIMQSQEIKPGIYIVQLEINGSLLRSKLIVQ
jgi:hypothetical protein